MAEQDSDCIFCKIVAGQIPARVVASTRDALAFLDIHPLADGHTMVVPRAHARHVHEMGEGARRAVMDLTAQVAGAMREAFGVEATTIGINDGADAGQVVPHVHVHVVPRRPGDGGGHVHSLMKGRGTADLDAVHQKLQATFARQQNRPRPDG